MAWYSAGTVSLTKDSNVVNGTGTQFIANTKSGDIFFGPDGLLYEVDRIVSDTQMVLRKNYLGASNTSAPYTIIPTTAYLKTLAAQVSDLIALYSDVPHHTEAAQAAAAQALGYRNDANAAMAGAQAARDTAETWKTQAANSASSASASASTATQAKTDAVSAQQSAASSQAAAINAKTAAESARDAAASSATQSAQSASQAASTLANKMDRSGSTLIGPAQFWYDAAGIAGGYALGFHYGAGGSERMSFGGLGSADVPGNWQCLFFAAGSNGYDQSSSPAGVWVDVGGTLRTKGGWTHKGTATLTGAATLTGTTTVDGQMIYTSGASAPLTLRSANPTVVFQETDRTLPEGLWRIVADGGSLQIRRNAAAAGDFSAEATPLILGAAGEVAMSVRPTFAGSTPWDSSNLPSPMRATGGTINGYVEINHATNSSKLGVKNYGNGYGVGVVFAAINDSATTAAVFYSSTGSQVGSISQNASIVSYNTSSDYRLKQNYAPIVGALASVNRMRFYTGEYKSEPGKLVDYVLAHEQQAETAFAVTGEKDAMGDFYPLYRDGYDPKDIRPEDVIGITRVMIPQAVDYAKLVPRIGASVQELSALLEAAVERIAALEAARNQSN